MQENKSGCFLNTVYRRLTKSTFNSLAFLDVLADNITDYRIPRIIS